MRTNQCKTLASYEALKKTSPKSATRKSVLLGVDVLNLNVLREVNTGLPNTPLGRFPLERHRTTFGINTNGNQRLKISPSDTLL